MRDRRRARPAPGRTAALCTPAARNRTRARAEARAYDPRGEVSQQVRGQRETEHDPDEEAAEGDHRDEEALVVARPREERQQHEDSEVEAGHAGSPAAGRPADRQAARPERRRRAGGQPGPRRASCPRALPAPKCEQPVEQPGREAPDRHPRRPGTPGRPTRWGSGSAAGSAGSTSSASRHPVHRGDLRRRHRGQTGLGSRHQREDGRHDERRHGQEQRGQHGEDVDARGVDSGLLAGLAQRRTHRPIVTRVDGSAGERRLTGVRPELSGALDEQDVALSRRRLGPKSTRTAASRLGPSGIGGHPEADQVGYVVTAGGHLRQRPGARPGSRAVLDQLLRGDRVGLALAVGRAPARDRAGAARRSAGVAAPPAMEDQPVAEQASTPGAGRAARGPPRPRTGSPWSGPARAAGQPADVGVDGDPGDPERVAEHDVGGLAAHAGQGDQVRLAAVAPRRRSARTGPGPGR